MEKTAFSGYTILVVDDDTAIRELYETFFKAQGFTTLTATNGAKGLEVAQAHHPSLILLDIMMPVMDGRQMLKALREDPALKNTPVIMFSALIGELEKEDSIAAGATDYIEKSEIENPEDLLVKVKQILGLHDPAPTAQPAN